MAKIAIVAPQLNPSTLQLCESLSQYRHEVSLITSASQNIPTSFSFPILTFFKNWTAKESLYFISKYFWQTPDIWHFVFSDLSVKEILQAHWVLSLIGKSIPKQGSKRIAVGSFYNFNFQDLESKNLNWFEKIKLQFFLKQLDLVTTGTRESLMYLKRNQWVKKSARLEVLPPLPEEWAHYIKPQSEIINKTFHSELEILCRNSQPYLFIPTQLYNTDDLTAVCEHFFVFALGDRPLHQKIHPKIYYLGTDLTDADLLFVVENSKAICTSLEDLSLLELVKIQFLAMRSGRPIIANRRQVELLPGYVQDKKNGWVTDGHPRDILHIKANNPFLNLNLKKNNVTLGPLMDSTINELNRLYASVLAGQGIKRSV